MCGDNYAQERPRSNELGGRYGQGIIVRTYEAGATVEVSVQITANHKGHFYFYLCNLDDYNGVEEEECFTQHRVSLANGDDKYELLTNAAGYYSVMLQLPADLRCKHCVLQWTYKTGRAKPKNINAEDFKHFFSIPNS